ncbi:unnamed protein product, partial [Amoebophrya sp. A25]
RTWNDNLGKRHTRLRGFPTKLGHSQLSGTISRLSGMLSVKQRVYLRPTGSRNGTKSR